jgi:hypothetical protein
MNFPYLVPRWSKATGENILEDHQVIMHYQILKTLNKSSRNRIKKHGQKAIDPPLLVSR